MKKLYEKNELYFALAAILIYVIGMGNLRGNFGDTGIVPFTGMAVYTAVLVYFLCSNHLTEKYGLTKFAEGKKYLYFIPFILMGTVNLWMGIDPHAEGMDLLFGIGTMAMVGFAEEMLFRGFLYKAIDKDNHTEAIVISAVTFGAGHIINLLTGHGTLDTVMQMGYAMAIGLTFVLVFVKSGSLWPAIITHAMIDITHLFSNTALSAEQEFLFNTAGTIFLLVICAFYSIYLWKQEA